MSHVIESNFNHFQGIIPIIWEIYIAELFDIFFCCDPFLILTQTTKFFAVGVANLHVDKCKDPVLV